MLRSIPSLLLFAAAFASASVSARAQDSGIPVGSAAPGAAVERLDGTAADLSSVIGKKPVLLEFWASWCPNCRALESQLQAVKKTYGDKIRMVGVAVSVNQSPERAKAYAEKHGLPIEIFYDRHGNATDAYDVPATSYIVIVNRQGKIVYTGLGSEQDLVAAVKRAM